MAKMEKKQGPVTIEMLSEHKPAEAWLIFRMDILVGGQPADVCILMDIGSGFVFGHLIVLNMVPSLPEFENLMQKAYGTLEKWPEVLYCSMNDPAIALFERTAAGKGIRFQTAPGQVFYEISEPVIKSFRRVSAPPEPDEISEEEKEMARFLIPDSYDPCFCASGKKFKFCCKPVFPEIAESMALTEEGKIKQALECLDRAREKAGLTPEILCRYAIVYSYSDKKKSDEHRAMCLKLNPRHPRANYIMGIDLKESGDYEKALEAYMAAAENYPPGDRFHLNEVWNNIGTVYYELGNYKSAGAAWEKALKYMPQDKTARKNMELLDSVNKAGTNSASAELAAILRVKVFSSQEDMEQFVSEYARKKNSSPLDELGGLSPLQAAGLLYEPQGSAKSPITLSSSIKEALLENSLFYTDAKNILTLFNKLQPVKMTVSKNLNRKFVLEAYNISEYAKKNPERYYCSGAMNEDDFWWLHIMRVVFSLAGLIRIRKGNFYVTADGRQYLEKPGGELFVKLFRTFFYKFNLDYLSYGGPDISGIQRTVNFSLFMARTYCSDWKTCEDFTEKVVFEGMRLDKEYDRIGNEYISAREILVSAYMERFIQAMIDFGFFDTKESDNKPEYGKRVMIRTSELMKSFVNFDFQPRT